MKQVCTLCNIEKPLAEFYSRKGSKTGYRKDCKLCVNARNRKWEATHPEQNKKRMRDYMRENRFKSTPRSVQLVKKKKFREANRDKIAAKKKEWHEANKERVRAYNISRRPILAIHASNRRALKKFSGGELSFNLAETLLNLQKGKCRICKSKIQGKDYHLDHITPLIKGGAHSDKNMQLLCPTCNLKKGSKLPHVYAQQIGRLFL